MHARSTILVSLVLLCSWTGCTPDFPTDDPWTLAELEIDVADTSREIGFTNTQAGFYYTESNGWHRSSWQGWHISSVKVMADYRLDADGRPLDRSTSDYARVWPHEFTRSYHEGVQETFLFLDSLDGFIVSMENLRARSVGISLVFDLSADLQGAVEPGDDALIFSPFSTVMRRTRPDVPGWIGITALGEGVRVTDSTVRLDGHALRGQVRQAVHDGRAGFIVVAGSTPEEARALLHRIKGHPDAARMARVTRMERLLNQSFLRTSDERFDKAFAWALLSMDALVMNQGRKGIFAGLPWFSNYWGRDTFISLPGATLVTGRFGEAKEILRSFAAWQNTDPLSPDDGRVPNIVTPTSIAFNTTDGTPWFVLGVYDYIRSSGDTAFAREIYPVIRRAADGPLRHRVDTRGLLTHADAETWMDAVGPDGPWSPRGNRANDIQALWYRQLSASSSLAALLGKSGDARRWGTAAEEALHAFRTMFIDMDSPRIYDHLNPDGTPDPSLRPNQLFALDLVPGSELQARIFRTLTEELVYEHGVGSLSPHDENFHPYHHVEPLYVQDAAYHNGIVWTWLNGPWIEHAVRLGHAGIAHRITDNMVHQILERGAVGTISELLDAAPRSGETEPRLSGTFSQAWSLAEFLRTTYRSYLGVKVDAVNGQVWLAPQLPTTMEAATFDVFVGPTTLRVSYASTGNGATIRLTPSASDASLSVSLQWQFPDGRRRSVNVELIGNETTDVVLTPDGSTAETESGRVLDVDTQVQSTAGIEALKGMSLATPLVRSDLRSLSGPDHPIIGHEQITYAGDAGTRLAHKDDPVGDDTGSGSYVYPSTAALRPGSLDLTGFAVGKVDSATEFVLRFRALSNPGWHPEYGFQLTYVAIAIDTDGIPGSGNKVVGRNAQYTLRDGWEYERIIYVGGGVQVEDAEGHILGAYLPSPEDITRPLGDAVNATITFTLFPDLIGVAEANWRYTVLVGAQDDHGGAGLGEFRNVNVDGGEWTGGGKKRPGDPNVYDVLTLP